MEPGNGQPEKPKFELGKVHTWRPSDWAKFGTAGLVVLLLVVVVGAISLGTEEDSGTPNEKASAQEPVDPTGTISCPRLLFVGIPVNLDVTMKNPGRVRYGATFLHLDNGFERFTVNNVSSQGATLQKEPDAVFDPTYVAGGVRGKRSRNFRITMTPIEAGNVTLKIRAWQTDSREDGTAYERLLRFECEDVPVNP